MKKGTGIAKKFALTASFISFVVLAWLAIDWARLPRHQSRTIRHWFYQAIVVTDREYNDAEWKKVESAFHAMGSEAVPFLLDHMGQEISFNAISARLNQWKYDPYLPIWFKRLLPVTADEERRTAFQLLTMLGPKAIGEQERLERMMEDKEHQFEILYLLETMGQSASSSSPAVARCLFSNNDSIRHLAADTFTAITPPRSPHAERLKEAIRSGHITAGKGLPILANLETDFRDLLPILSNEICSTNGMVRLEALNVCRSLKVEREAILPRIGEALQNPDPRFRGALLQALRSLGPEAAPAIDQVLPLLSDPYAYVRAEAARTLGSIGPSASPALEKLRAMHSDPNYAVVEAAREAMSLIAK